MGNLTTSVDIDGRTMLDSGNGGVLVRFQLTMSSLYATGGDSFLPNALGLGTITKVIINNASIGGNTTAYTATPVYATSGGPSVTKVQAFVSGTAGQPMTEVSANTNLSTVTFDAIAFGT